MRIFGLEDSRRALDERNAVPELLTRTGGTRLVAARSDRDKARGRALHAPRIPVEWVEVSAIGEYK
jgi:hypothetical protein